MQRSISVVAVAALLVTPALAHTGVGATSGFSAGVMHPLTGLDHLIAMVAVGLLAGFSGGRALWLWPTSFVSLMLFGAYLGASGIDLPARETLIVVSILVLGAIMIGVARLPVILGAAVIGLIAVFHGHAHGAEMAPGVNGLEYAAGFAAATAALHGCGITIARLNEITGEWLRPVAGGAIVAAGIVLASIG